MIWTTRAAAISVFTILAGVASVLAPGGSGRLSAGPGETRGNAAAAADSGESELRSVLDGQTAEWNRGDVVAFMEGYRKSEDTEFVSASGITRGWQAVLDRYRKNYPDRKAMGHLSFSNLEIHMVCADAAFVIGQFQLERGKDRRAGVFTLNFRRFDEGWRIVADHTTGFADGPAPERN
jgi:ketosteroid isomerase-like protein